MRVIDLRSDTVTLPTPEMREAIYHAELGDDVYGEDRPTKRLEEMAADITGKEAALLVPSGTMANLTCVLTHCARGEEVILGDKSHIFLNEAGGISALGGAQVHTICNQPDGSMLLKDIKEAIRNDNIHYPRTRLICIENTHNRCNGSPLSPDYVNSVVELAKNYGLSVHLDGARIFNAAIALGIKVKKLTHSVDSIMFCLSKGLSAPIGSIICGSHKFISEAIRTRKILGGGMRQTGIIAAAGIISLEKMVERLSEDHMNAYTLAEGIAQIPGLSIDVSKIKTNIIYFDLTNHHLNTDEFAKKCGQKGLMFLPTGQSRFRMVTHYGITSEDIKASLITLREVMEAK
jgi:threonine aldolase